MGPEAAGLDAHEADPPLWLHLLGKAFGEAFDCLFGGAVGAQQWHSHMATDTGDLLDETAGRRVGLAHGANGGAGNADDAEEVDVHLVGNLLVGKLLEGASQAVAGIVDDHDDAVEAGERGGDADGRSDVESEGEVVGRSGGGEGEGGGLASCGDGDVAFVEDRLDERGTEAGRAAGDEEDSRHDVLKGCKRPELRVILVAYLGAVCTCFIRILA